MSSGEGLDVLRQQTVEAHALFDRFIALTRTALDAVEREDGDALRRALEERDALTGQLDPTLALLGAFLAPALTGKLPSILPSCSTSHAPCRATEHAPFHTQATDFQHFQESARSRYPAALTALRCPFNEQGRMTSDQSPNKAGAGL